MGDSIAARAKRSEAALDVRSTGVRRIDPPADRAFLSAVLDGLARTPPALPARYMYDDVGARLFACLASADDHYATRAELGLLLHHAQEIAGIIGARATFIDPSAGDGLRAAQLAARLSSPLEIVLGDRVPGAAARAAAMVRTASPAAPVLALDALDPWSVRPPRGASRVAVHLGGTLTGELTPAELRAALATLHASAGDDARLLAGVDLVKDARSLEAAYADRAGIAASFDLNLLARINRELRGTFSLAAWGHRAVFDHEASSVEMQLVAKRAQWCSVGARWFGFSAGDSIRTLVSYKHTLEDFATISSTAGWSVDRVLFDPNRTYALVVCRS